MCYAVDDRKDKSNQTWVKGVALQSTCSKCGTKKKNITFPVVFWAGSNLENDNMCLKIKQLIKTHDEGCCWVATSSSIKSKRITLFDVFYLTKSLQCWNLTELEDVCCFLPPRLPKTILDTIWLCPKKMEAGSSLNIPCVWGLMRTGTKAKKRHSRSNNHKSLINPCSFMCGNQVTMSLGSVIFLLLVEYMITEQSL